MKKIILLGFGIAASRLHAQFPAISFTETHAEFSGRADVDANGIADVIIVDKATGSVRVCYQTAPGVFSWDQPKASGIGSVTGVTAGRLLNASQDALAVTAPEANRINLLGLSQGAAIVPQSVFITPVGPMCLAAANLNGTIAADDLWVGSVANSAPSPGSFDQFVNNPAGTFTFQANRHTSASQFDSANNVMLKIGLAGTFAYLEHVPAGEVLRVISASSVSAPVKISLSDVPLDSSYIIAPFGSASLASVVTWRTGDAYFSTRTVAEPFPLTFTVTAAVNVPTSQPIGQLIMVPTSATTSKLLSISPDGSSATYYDFNGTVLSAPIDTIIAPAGESITGGVALPAFAGFQLLRGPAGDGRTATARYLKWNASTGKFADVGGTNFGTVGKRSGSGNVLLFSGEPFVSPNATLVGRLNAQDWSSGVAPLPPALLNFTGETFGSAALGLRSPLAVSLGVPPAGTTHVLLNQINPAMSLFSLSPAMGASIGEPIIDPPSGQYSQSIQLTFKAPPGMVVKFRDAGGSWQTFTQSGTQPPKGPGDATYEAWWATFRPLVRFKNTQIDYYGQIGAKRSPILTATFKFTAAPESLSSLGDGVPDYVKLGLHYNPFTPPPDLLSNEQGGYMNRILAASVADYRRFTQGALDFFVRPMSIHGPSFTTVASRVPAVGDNVTKGNSINAYTLNGLSLAASDDDNGVDDIPPGLRNWPAFALPSARLSGLSGQGNGGLTVLSTGVHYSLQEPILQAIPRIQGREMVGVRPLPSAPSNTYARSYTGGTDAAEAAAWKAGAISFFNTHPVPSELHTLDSLDTMAVLVLERWMLKAFVQRAILPQSYQPATPNAATPPTANPNYLSLTAFRLNEVVNEATLSSTGPVYPTSAQILSLSDTPPPSTSYRLSDVLGTITNLLRNSPDTGIVNLRSVVNDVYRISSRYANQSKGGFELPVDALRKFLATGAVSGGYSSKLPTLVAPAVPLPGAPYSTLTDAQLTSAINGMQTILQQILHRTWNEFDLLVRADTIQPNITLLDDTMAGGQVNLREADGSAFQFPSGFVIAAGTHIHVTGYTDLPSSPVGPQVEVASIAGIASAQITSVAVPTAISGSNLLPDDWETFFFGHTGIDPFSSPPGSNVSYLQIYLEGKDPCVPISYGMLTPILKGMPQLDFKSTPPGGGIKLGFKMPALFAQKFEYQLQDSTDVASFTQVDVQFTETNPGEFEITLPITAQSRHFWRLGLVLK